MDYGTRPHDWELEGLESMETLSLCLHDPAHRRPPAKQGEHQEYIDLLSLHRQPLQKKQCFHNQYAYLSAVRNNYDGMIEES